MIEQARYAPRPRCSGAAPQKMKAGETDIVELTEDVQGFPRGTQGTVVTAFTEPSEAYDVEVDDGKLVYSVKPEQLTVVKKFSS